MKLIATLLPLLLLCIGIPAQIVINEYCAANNSLNDAFGKTPDWIELHNSGATNIDLTGYFLKFSLSRELVKPGLSGELIYQALPVFLFHI